MVQNGNHITPFASDQELISDLIENRQGAFDAFKRKYFSMIHALVYKNSGTRQDAEDLFQETFWVFWNNLSKPQFKLTCQLSTYLYAVAHRIWLKHIQKNQKSSLYIEQHKGHEFIDEQLEAYEDYEQRLVQLNTALDALGNPCSDLLKDYYLHNYSMDKIAEKWNYTNTDTAKTQKYKCLQRLRKLFKDVSK